MIKPQDVKHLLENRIKRNSDLVYFYNKIQSPDWIFPLSQLGVFKEMPEPVVEGDVISYPHWPEGQYLLRMAQLTTVEEMQERIADIIVNISDSENQYAESVRVQIATALPVNVTSSFIRKLQNRLSGESFFCMHWADAIVKLLLCVAKAGGVSQVLYPLKLLLKVLPDPREKEEIPLGLPEIRVATDRWYYAKIIEEDLPEFVEACGPLKVLETVLCPLLEKIGRFNSQLDHSFIWRPNIQKSEIDETSPLQLLTSATVVTAEQATQENPECISELVELLEKQKPSKVIFGRIMLHVLTQASEESHSLVTDRLTSLEIISNAELRTEYDNLLHGQFPNLLPEQQDKIVKVILAGPQLEIENYSQKSIAQDKWTLMMLHQISEHLSNEVSQRYHDLRSIYPTPELLQQGFPPVKFESWTGPTSPVSLDEMGKLSPLEVIAFLKEWIPERDWGVPSPEGLSRILAISVENNAAAYANQANAFSDVEPTYVKALFYGLTETNQKFSWGPVLQLSKWVVDQSRDYDYAGKQMTDGQSFGQDPDWGWTRKAIAHLLKRGLGNTPLQIPQEFQEDIWYICKKLLCDPEPTPEYEREYGGDLFDLSNMAINTVRGTTMHVVMGFVKWNDMNLRERVDPQSVRGRLNILPNVRDVLEAHLSIKFDPSLSVRAVYGEWFSCLYRINKEWASGLIPILFSLERDKQEYFLAAWYSFCSVSRINIELFELLREQYMYAIELLKSVPRDRMRSEYQMAEELARLFVSEDGYTSVKATIDKFFSLADDHLRSCMLRHMAVSSLSYDGKPVMPCVDRLKCFWDQRLAILEESETPNDSQKELEAYGKWFLLDCFSPDWALKQLLRTLSLAKKVDDRPAVCEKLTSLSSDYPKEVTECIRCLVEQGNKWFLARTDYCRTILSQVIDSGDEEAAESAKQVINHLVARGFSDYRSIVLSSD